jgi:hypothetical protein
MKPKCSGGNVVVDARFGSTLSSSIVASGYGRTPDRMPEARSTTAPSTRRYNKRERDEHERSIHGPATSDRGDADEGSMGAVGYSPTSAAALHFASPSRLEANRAWPPAEPIATLERLLGGRSSR